MGFQTTFHRRPVLLMMFRYFPVIYVVSPCVAMINAADSLAGQDMRQERKKNPWDMQPESIRIERSAQLTKKRHLFCGSPLWESFMGILYGNRLWGTPWQSSMGLLTDDAPSPGFRKPILRFRRPRKAHNL